MASSSSTDASTQWSEYVWHAERRMWVANRINARGEVEYYYRNPDPEPTTTSQAVPRSFGQTADDSRATVATTAYTLTPIAGSGRGTSPIYSVPATAVYAPTSLNNPVASSYDTNAATSFSTEAGDSQPIALAQTSSPVRSDSAGSKPEYPWTQYGVYTSSTIGYPSTREDSDAPDNVANDLGGLSLHKPSAIPGNDVSYPQVIANIPNPPPNSSSCELLDDRYRKVDEKDLKKFWKVGRVFMMLWTEPARDDIDRQGSQFSTTYLGCNAFSEIRRFVVVREGYGNCKCSPIHTYGGQATLKPNLPEPKQHAIIYTSTKPPDELSYTAENGTIVREELNKQSIKVRKERTDKDGDLGNLSRLNYSKVYTVENFVRVLNIGMVEKEWLLSLNQNSHMKPPNEPIEKPRKHPSKSGHKKQDHSYKGKGKGKESEKKHHSH